MKKRPARKPSPKTNRAPARPLNEAIESCRHISTLAGLLEQCGRTCHAELIEPRLVGNVGGMIAVESQAVEEFLRQLEMRGRV